MSKRYMTRQSWVGDWLDAWEADHDDKTRPANPDVYCVEDAPIRTGLVDADGNSIYRVPERRPIGFRLRS